jgi:putative oxidoreductase
MSPVNNAGRWSLLVLRLLVGYGFMAHGLAKVSRGADAFAGILQHLGVPLPLFAAWLTIGAEILGDSRCLLVRSSSGSASRWRSCCS